jgi:peptidoglycan hydrolase-like protein with peptidoglycan-binding domain
VTNSRYTPRVRRTLIIGAFLLVLFAAAAAGFVAWHTSRATANPVHKKADPAVVVYKTSPSRVHGVRPKPKQPYGHPILFRYPLVQDGSKGPDVLRLQQLLAAYGYLPVKFTASETRAMPTSPRPGKFAWKFAAPSQLTDAWEPGLYGTVTRGAVMTFQAVNGMPADGVAGQQVWQALLSQHPKYDPVPYTYAIVHETLPESISIYRAGKSVFTSPANTGIPQAPTAQGTFPVYLRYTSTTMSGTNPDGSHYNDPGVPWVSYFNGGDAVHGFLRGSYGSPQSLGCVELPYSTAQQAYDLMNYGTLVTVTS